MSQIDKKIANEIREIANGSNNQRMIVMSGTVVAGSVDDIEGTCTVLLTTNDKEAPTEGVLITSVTSNTNGVTFIPADDSHVWVAEIDEGKWGIVKTSNVEKVIVKISDTQEMEIESGKIVFNGGSNGGLCITPTLKTELEKTTTLLQHIVNTINGATIPEAGSGGSKCITTSSTGSNSGRHTRRL